MLRQVFPNATFWPPATESEISTAESELGIRIPAQLRTLYLICNGFREDRGNTKYLLSLIEDDFIGSLVTVTRSMWTEFQVPNLRPFVFFGVSSGGASWGIDWKRPTDVIAYHHHMENEYEVVGTDVVEVFRTDYARYEELEQWGQP